jgi:hypothetical protein
MPLHALSAVSAGIWDGRAGASDCAGALFLMSALLLRTARRVSTQAEDSDWTLPVAQTLFLLRIVSWAILSWEFLAHSSSAWLDKGYFGGRTLPDQER